jgi:hypothetical protein
VANAGDATTTTALATSKSARSAPCLEVFIEGSFPRWAGSFECSRIFKIS